MLSVNVKPAQEDFKYQAFKHQYPHAHDRWQHRNNARQTSHKTLFRSQTRRVRVEKERSDLAIHTAAHKAGGYKPRNVAIWRKNAYTILSIDTQRADRRKNLTTLINYLISRQDPKTLTILTTWDAITKATNLTRRTIARLLAILREHKLLSTVATGRSARYTPKSTGRTKNEAPVYGLILPHTQNPVEKNGTPDPVREGYIPVHARARENDHEKSRDGYAVQPLGSRRKPAATLAALAKRHQRKESFTGTCITVAYDKRGGLRPHARPHAKPNETHPSNCNGAYPCSNASPQIT